MAARPQGMRELKHDRSVPRPPPDPRSIAFLLENPCISENADFTPSSDSDGRGWLRFRGRSDLDQVKAEFGDEPEIYNEFLEIMKSFKSQQIDTPGVIRRVSTLFEGYGKLIYGFNTFLPEGYKIEVPEHLREQLRGQVNAVPRGQQAAPAPPPRPRAPARRPARPVEDPPRQPVEFDNAIAYVTAIKKRFEHQPETYKAFLEVLHTSINENKKASRRS